MKFKTNDEVKFKDKYNVEIFAKVVNVDEQHKIYGTVYLVKGSDGFSHLVPEKKLLFLNEKYSKDYRQIFSKKYLLAQVKAGKINISDL